MRAIKLRWIGIVILLMAVSTVLHAQDESLDSLRSQLEKTHTQEGKIDLLNKLSRAYSQVSLETAEQFAQDALDQGIAINYQSGVATSYNNLGIFYSIRGQYATGMDYFVKALTMREEQNDHVGVSRTLNNISRVYILQNDFDKALDYSKRSLEMLSKVNDNETVASAHISLGSIYLNRKEYPQALKMFEAARDLYAKEKLQPQEGWALMHIGRVYKDQQDYAAALKVCMQASEYMNPEKDLFTAIQLYETIGSIYTSMGDVPNASIYLHRAIYLADRGNDSNGRLTTRSSLADMFKTVGRSDSALYYRESYQKLSEEIFTAEKAKQLALLEKVYQTEKQERILESKNQLIRSQYIIITTISVLLVVLCVFGVIIVRNLREKRRVAGELEKLNREIMDKHEEILAQSEELSEANDEIRRINDSLEQEALRRADKIAKQNEILVEYAYFNAHNVRGPLARILGLVGLMINETSVPTVKQYNELIHKSANELDEVIREINGKLQNDE